MTYTQANGYPMHADQTLYCECLSTECGRRNQNANQTHGQGWCLCVCLCVYFCHGVFCVEMNEDRVRICVRVILCLFVRVCVCLWRVCGSVRASVHACVRVCLLVEIGVHHFCTHAWCF